LRTNERTQLNISKLPHVESEKLKHLGCPQLNLGCPEADRLR